MSGSKAFHLGFTKKDLNGAQLAIVPGDPDRVLRLGKRLSNAREIAYHREFRTVVGDIDGKPVVICSTGIGGPSTSICVEELAQFGVKSFLRIGTTGAIQENIRIGDLIVTNAAVRLDGTSDHFAPPEYPAVADFHLTRILVDSSVALGHVPHVGVTASSATFYPGQERYDTYTESIIRRFQGSMNEWRQLGVLNYEMESATLFTCCSSMGLSGACIAGVIVNRMVKERVEDKVMAAVEVKAIDVVIEAAKRAIE